MKYILNETGNSKLGVLLQFNNIFRKPDSFQCSICLVDRYPALSVESFNVLMFLPYITLFSERGKTVPKKQPA